MLFNNKFSIVGLFVLVLAFSMNSCKSKGDSEPIETETAVPPFENEEFVTFYNTFSSDSIFQMEHITFPLEGTRPQEDSTDVVPDDFRWTQDNWKLHRPFDDGNKTFVRQFENGPGNIIIEYIADKSGQYTMERRFAKLSAGWHLIYYRKMGKY